MILDTSLPRKNGRAASAYEPSASHSAGVLSLFPGHPKASILAPRPQRKPQVCIENSEPRQKVIQQTSHYRCKSQGSSKFLVFRNIFYNIFSRAPQQIYIPAASEEDPQSPSSAASGELRPLRSATTFQQRQISLLFSGRHKLSTFLDILVT